MERQEIDLATRLRHFKHFANVPDDAITDLRQSATVEQLPAGYTINVQDSIPHYVPIVLSGNARAYTTDRSGQPTTLYRVRAGESCVLAAACSISTLPVPGASVVETPGDVLLLPRTVYREWVHTQPFWCHFNAGLVAQQLTEVIAITNSLAFRPLPSRIANHLLESAGADDVVRETHDLIAIQLSTARPVVSRLLKTFERDGMLSLARGAIHIHDRSALISRAKPS